MTAAISLEQARKIAKDKLMPGASERDKNAAFPKDAMASLGEAGLFGIGCPTEHGGLGSDPHVFLEIVTALAEADASAAMVYNMHVCGTLCLAAAAKSANVNDELKAIAQGKHLTTLAFSEKGSRSHFWAPVSKAEKTNDGVKLNASKSWVTSANFADSYVTSALAPNSTEATATTIYLVSRKQSGVKVTAPFDGLGLRANDSAPVELEGVQIAEDKRLSEDGAGMKMMLEVVLPFFNLGTSAVALGLCQASVAATAKHLKSARLEHLGTSLGEGLPTLRARLAQMHLATQGLRAQCERLATSLKDPNEETVLRVLETKAIAGTAAIDVTAAAMRACGGAAFSRHTSVRTLFS